VQKSFSIKTYGHDTAKAMAIAERQRQLQQVQQINLARQSQSARAVEEANGPTEH